MVTKGQRAPEFTAKKAGTFPPDDFTLEDALGDGPVVLAFFPGAFTEVCTTEMSSFRDSLEDFEELNATVYGISVDSPFTLNEFKDQYDLSFPLVSDFNKDIIEKYNVVIDEIAGLKGLAQRSVFVLDEGGEVVYEWVSEDPTVLPDFDEIKEAVERARE